MIKLGLTNENYKWIAEKIHKDCEPEMVIAFSRVECRREPFDKDGFPAILYERHVFFRNVKNRVNRTAWTKQYSTLCYPSGYGRGGYGSFASQRVKLSKAMSLDKEAAMEACSWGPFQELGENWEDYGFSSIGEFVDTMKNGLYGASDIFIRSIKHRGLVQPMVKRQYTVLASKYNGAGYKEFHYDDQIQGEYTKAKKLKIDWAKIKSIPPTKNLNPIWLGEKLPIVKLTPDSEDEIAKSHSEEPVETKINEPEKTETESQSTEENSESNINQTDSKDTLEIKADGAGNLDIKKNTINKPQEVVAIEKADEVGFLEKMWKKIVAFFTGNIGLDAIGDKLQQTQALGLSSSFWERAMYLGVGATLIYFIAQFYKHWQQKKHENELTQSLITANTTPENTIHLVDSWRIPLFEKQGIKVIRRGSTEDTSVPVGSETSNGTDVIE